MSRPDYKARLVNLAAVVRGVACEIREVRRGRRGLWRDNGHDRFEDWADRLEAADREAREPPEEPTT